MAPMNPNCRVLMIAYTYYDSDARVIRAAEAAVHGGYEVDCLALRRPGERREEKLRGVNVIRIRQSRYRGSSVLRYLFEYVQFFVRCLLRSAGLFVRRRYCIVHVNNMPDFLVFTALIPKVFGARIILDIHDSVPDTFASKFRRGPRGVWYRLLMLEERVSAWCADVITTVHEPMKNMVLVKHGLDTNSIQVISNFPDTELFRPQELPALDGTIRMVFHGTILMRSGLHHLLLALARMRNRQAICVDIIGEGDYAEELSRLIVKLGLQGTVHFDRRTYPAYEIPARISQAHLGLAPLEVSPSTDYALPVKLLEYIAVGKPVLTVKNAAIKYYFSDEDCLFYDAGNVESLKSILEHVAENPAVLRKYHERASTLRSRFSWHLERTKYIALLKTLCTVHYKAG